AVLRCAAGGPSGTARLLVTIRRHVSQCKHTSRARRRSENGQARLETRDMLWRGRGDPERAAPLPESGAGRLRDMLGVRPAERPPAALDAGAAPAGRLNAEGPPALPQSVGGSGVPADAETRGRHTRGKSTPALLRIRSGDAGD